MSQKPENGAMLTANDKIIQTFNRLRQEYQNSRSKITTKEEEAEKSKNQQLLNKTIDYTVDNIVNGMAALQLNFGGAVNQLAANLTTEADKLAELKKAIAVEQEHLEYLKQVRLAADALHILNREHAAKIKIAEAKSDREKAEIEQEIKLVRKSWAKEQQEFAQKIKEQAELTALQREQEAANYQYELERQRTIEADDYAEDKRLQQRELAELATSKQKDWDLRTKQLAATKPEFTANQEKIAGFETKLKEEYGKSKGTAIKDADSKYKVAAELETKEWSAKETGYQLKIASLTAVIERQLEQINEINTQLQEVNTQAQNLAMQAFQ